MIYLKALQRPCLKPVRKIKQQVPTCIPHACLHDERILPDFISAYSTLLCNGGFHCLEKAILPPYDDQVTIIQTMRSISQHIDVSDVLPTVFTLLMKKDSDHLAELLDLIQIHDQLAHQIQDIIKHADINVDNVDAL